MKAILKNKGFTLVELMIVIVIVGILAAVAIPKFNIAADKARASEFPTVLTAVYTNQDAYKAEQGTYADNSDWTTISMEAPVSKWFSYAFDADANGTSYVSNAGVKSKFGDAATGLTATINHTGGKDAQGVLTKYAPQWK